MPDDPHRGGVKDPDEELDWGAPESSKAAEEPKKVTVESEKPRFSSRTPSSGGSPVARIALVKRQTPKERQNFQVVEVPPASEALARDVRSSPPPEAPRQTPTTSSPSSGAPQKRKGPGRVLVAIVAVLCISAIAVLAFRLFGAPRAPAAPLRREAPASRIETGEPQAVKSAAEPVPPTAPVSTAEALPPPLPARTPAGTPVPPGSDETEDARERRLERRLRDPREGTIDPFARE